VVESQRSRHFFFVPDLDALGERLSQQLPPPWPRWAMPQSGAANCSFSHP
jgi:hypothetical protein